MIYTKNKSKNKFKIPASPVFTSHNEVYPDDEDLTDCTEFAHFYKRQKPLGVCPRCGNKSKVCTKDPYCSDCNWDSLEDSTWVTEPLKGRQHV